MTPCIFILFYFSPMQAQDFEDLLTDQEIILVAEDYLLNGYFISVVPTKTIFLDSNLEVFQVELSNLLRGQTSNNTDACNVTTMFREIIENHSQEQGFTGRNRLKGQ